MQVLKTIKITLISFLIGTSITFATYSSEPASELEDIRKQIKKGYEEADYKILLEAHKEFSQLNHSEEEWKATIKRLNAHQWSQQSLKEVVGGHLFYPSDVNDMWDYPYLNHFLQRTDAIWGFAISAKYKNPLARYYLAWDLDNIGSEVRCGSEGRDPFITDLYDKAFNLLEQSYQNSPEACYVLGINHAHYAWKIGIKDLNIEEALKYHEVGAKLGDPRNRLAALETQRIYKRVFKKSPEVRDYVALAEKGYRPAYLAIPRFQIGNDEKVKYLEKAIDNNFPYSFIDIGKFYEWMGNKEDAFKYYKKASNLPDSTEYLQKVVATGYLQMAKTILGDLVLDKKSREHLVNIEAESLNEATNYIEKATNLNDPKACEQLIALYKIFCEIEDDDRYISNLETFLKKGMKLGLSSAYRKVYKFFPEKYETFVENYGVYPQDDLIQPIKKFLLL